MERLASILTRVEIQGRRLFRQDALRSMRAQQDFLRICETLGKEGVLFIRLENRLKPYIEKGSVESLCRMITFVIDEVRKDPSIPTHRKAYLESSLNIIKKSYESVS